MLTIIEYIPLIAEFNKTLVNNKLTFETLLLGFDGDLTKLGARFTELKDNYSKADISTQKYIDGKRTLTDCMKEFRKIESED